MFSRFRRSKSERPVVPEDVTSDLRGMPALKQRRSERREESLHSVLSSLTEIDTTRSSNSNGSSVHRVEDEPIFGEINIPRNYKRPLSPGNVENRDSRHSNYVDRVVNGHGSHFVFEDEKDGNNENVFVENDDEEQSSLNTSWRMSKGDSGYKSKDDETRETNNNKKKKSKRNRNKSNEQEQQTRASGLYTIKQQRKASRESGSHSMRALTPKERDSILCLEEVLKDHLVEGENAEEVFGVESSDNDEEILHLSTKQSDNEETVDYGYASVNDMSRKYSLESTESVGSIIDLVGNLSSSPTSPSYVITDMSKKNHDVTDSHDATKSRNGEVKTSKSEVTQSSKKDKDHYGTFAHDVMMQLDEVIQSFSIHTTDDETPPVEESYLQKERKKEKRTRRQDSKSSDGEKERKKREKRKTRDPEKEKERKERRKKKKEERKTREDPNSREESLRRKEAFAKHVDEISALTQDMIKTAQQEQYSEEPVYAKVDKSKKSNKRERELQNREDKEAQNELIDPPSPFSNRLGSKKGNTETSHFTKHHDLKSSVQSDTTKAPETKTPTPTSTVANNLHPDTGIVVKYESNRTSWGPSEEKKELTKTPEKFSNLTYTSTPIGSPGDGQKDNLKPENKFNSPKKSTSVGLRRPVSDASDYYVRAQPYMSKYLNRTPEKPFVSKSQLEESSNGLRHVDTNSGKGKVLHVEPSQHLIQETKVSVQQTTPTSPISHVEPPKLRREKPSEAVKTRFEATYKSKQIFPQNNRERGRPMSLNLDESGNLASLTDHKYHPISVKPHSHYVHDLKPIEKPNSKLRPFVITSTKKPIQLC